MTKTRGSIKSRDMETVFRKLDIRPLRCDHHIRGFVEVDGKKFAQLITRLERKTLTEEF